MAKGETLRSTQRPSSCHRNSHSLAWTWWNPSPETGDAVPAPSTEARRTSGAADGPPPAPRASRTRPGFTEQVPRWVLPTESRLPPKLAAVTRETVLLPGPHWETSASHRRLFSLQSNTSPRTVRWSKNASRPPSVRVGHHGPSGDAHRPVPEWCRQLLGTPL